MTAQLSGLHERLLCRWKHAVTDRAPSTQAHPAAAQLQRARDAAHRGLALHPIDDAAHRLVQQHAAFHARDGGVQRIQELLRAGLFQHRQPRPWRLAGRSGQLFQYAGLVEQCVTPWALVRDGLTCMAALA